MTPPNPTARKEGEELLALAERCEAATCADYAIDLEIAEYGYRNGALFGVNYDPQLWMERNCWEPTVSLDDAMTLVPESKNTMDVFSLECWTGAGIHEPHVRASAWVPGSKRVYAATPALALCAAALRARALSPARLQEEDK